MARSRVAWARRVAVVVGLLALAPAVAHAQAADVLFDQGKKLLDEGKYSDACALLKKSDELDPAVGTKFHLADCYAKSGQTATAWRIFGDVASISRTVGYQAGETAALERARQLEAVLSRLTVTLAPEQQGVRVTLDGVALTRDQLGAPMPLDPGTYTVEATAEGRKPFSASVQLGTDADQQSVDVPILEQIATNVPAAAPTEPPPEPAADAEPEADGSTQRLIGYIVGGVGVVGLGLGTVFGLTAMSKWDDRNSHCPGGRCDATAVQLADESSTAAMVSNITFGLGIVGLGVGGYLVFTAPSGPADASRSPTLVASGAVDSRGGSVTLRGSF